MRRFHCGFTVSNIPQALETGAEERFTKTGSPREPSGALCHRLPRIVFDDGRNCLRIPVHPKKGGRTGIKIRSTLSGRSAAEQQEL